ncbi:MAG: tetratricopeptide repeat protein, partial [Chloroflexi bacterium]|nr:tetratricopeptide repeat protein [Chloroflexota bacterium]
SAAYPRIHLGQLDLLEGNRETGSAQVEAAMRAEEPGRDLWLRWHGSRLLAERDLLDGQPAAALARLRPLVEQPGGKAPRGTIMFTLLFAPLAWAYLELDGEGEAEAILAEGMERASAQDHHLARADLLRVRGMLRTRKGRWPEAWEDLEDAVELARRMPDPHREAQARAVLGALAARTGKDAEAQDELREALTIFQRLGAHPYIRRVQRSLADSRL